MQKLELEIYAFNLQTVNGLKTLLTCKLQCKNNLHFYSTAVV